MSFGERFLAEPQHFPVPIDGVACGDRRIVLRVAGEVFELSGLSELQAEIAARLFAGFVIDRPAGGAAPIPVRVFRSAPLEFLRFELEGWAYDFDLAWEPGRLRMAGRNFVACCDWSPEVRATLWLNEDPADLHLAIPNIFRAVLANRLLETGGFLIHSSCVIDDGRALVFFGPSGAGKSTLARLSAESGRVVLGDDMNVLRFVDGRLMVEDFPLAGAIRRRPEGGSPVPVKGLYRIRHGSETTVRRLGPAEAYARLVACMPFVSREPARWRSLDDRLNPVLRQFQVAELAVDRSSTFPEIVSILESAGC